jgi:hypothetical protein
MQFAIALTQLAAVVLIVAAIWNLLGVWPAMLVIGVCVLLTATGLEHMRMRGDR